MPAHTPAVGMEHKLAALFSTDVAGYSRLMGERMEKPPSPACQL